MSENLDTYAQSALRGVALYAVAQARAEQEHILLRAKFREYKLQHQRLLVAHKLLKSDYQSLKAHYDMLLRQWDQAETAKVDNDA